MFSGLLFIFLKLVLNRLGPFFGFVVGPIFRIWLVFNHISVVLMVVIRQVGIVAQHFLLQLLLLLRLLEQNLAAVLWKKASQHQELLLGNDV